MPTVIAVTGLAGAGKTTATEFLSREGFGQRVYAGQPVLDEVIAQSLPPGAESEKIVRLELRRRLGPAAMAILAAPRILEAFQLSQSVVLDAVLSLEELRHYREVCMMSIQLLAIEAPFDVRSVRLTERRDRKMSTEELRSRDELDSYGLAISALLPEARQRVANQSTLDEFFVQIRRAAELCLSTSL